MTSSPFQFTIRRLALATFWLSACCGLFAIANRYFTVVTFELGVLSMCAAIYWFFSYSTATTDAQELRARRLAMIAGLIVTAIPICCAVDPLYFFVIGPAAIEIYESLFGDKQKTFLFFSQYLYCIWTFAFTVPFLLANLLLLKVISRRRRTWHSLWLPLAIGVPAIVISTTVANTIGVDYAISISMRTLLGESAGGPFHTQDFLAYRAIAWFLATAPLIGTILWFYSGLTAATPSAVATSRDASNHSS